MKTADTKKPKPDSLILFNVEELNRIGDNDEGFTLQMLAKFSQQLAVCSKSMKEAIDANDWAKVRLVAHKNIPSYAIMGSYELLSLLKYIDQNAEKPEEQIAVRRTVESVCDKNTDVILAIEDYLKKMRESITT